MTSVEPLLTPIRERANQFPKLRVMEADPGDFQPVASVYEEADGLETICSIPGYYPADEQNRIAHAIASAPTDMARLLAAVEAVLEQAKACDEMATITPDETVAAALRMAARGTRSAISAALGGDK